MLQCAARPPGRRSARRRARREARPRQGALPHAGVPITDLLRGSQLRRRARRGTAAGERYAVKALTYAFAHPAPTQAGPARRGRRVHVLGKGLPELLQQEQRLA